MEIEKENARPRLIDLFKKINKSDHRKRSEGKMYAPAGNRTRVCTVAGYYSTTRPLVLIDVVDVIEGDTKVIGSDGFFDNSFDHEIVSTVAGHSDVAEDEQDENT
ncbi:hypothetical protein SADUNF_Sadunf09G0061900 [Salix dunnii]|uniref:Uncharacterized protein n=1 Tax=Salix dunnii TaxID=1413687 RepID=A0A835JQQ9_9ROSI|nr:hypothetical protein SADUNF_Sadunf09G0061900 [Salix dunnii]